MSGAAARLLPALAARLASFGATVLGAVLAVELLVAFTPGDAIDLLPNAEQLRPRLAEEWGLDLPLPARLFPNRTPPSGPRQPAHQPHPDQAHTDRSPISTPTRTFPGRTGA